ncbi:BTB/POZ domain-containing protein 1-like isoform X1 [Mytilus galloprovincialis]|uniref:BTB/POZ domain-containing protein 1-like isoform X1 n=2 Tax=Mytilus galloprovincialis TaxID=29158 RepID=UPI003F7B4EB0
MRPLMKRGTANITEETEVKVARMASAGEDWRTGKSIIECNRYMLDNSVHTDVTFNVKSTMLLAHRTILISRSQVFESLLTSQASSGVISIPDIEPAVFGKMLSFIYCDSVDVDDSDAAGLLAAAKKYKISGLEALCMQKMKTGVSIESVCIVLNHAADSQLKDKCVEFIFKFPQQVIETSGFLQLQPQHLLAIIADDRFNVKEELIFETLVKWSEKECIRQNLSINLPHQNQVLGDIVKLVRFGLMEHKYVKEKCKKFLSSESYVDIMEELAELGNNSGLIKKKRGLVATPDDSNSVSSTLTSNSNSRVFDHGASSTSYGATQGLPSSFTSFPMQSNNTRVLHPRSNPMETSNSSRSSQDIPEVTDCIRPVEAVQRYSLEHRERVRLGYFIEREQRIIVERFEATQSGKAYTRDNKDGVSFISSENLKLHGMLIYGSHQRPGSYEIELEILVDTGIRGSDLQRVYALKTSMSSDGATKVYELIVSPAVMIESAKVYTIRALFKGQASFYGVKGVSPVLKNGLQIDFVTDITCLNLTSKEIGQFPGLIFEKV